MQKFWLVVRNIRSCDEEESPTPAAVRSKVYGRSIAGFAGVNPADGLDISLLCLLGVV